MSTAVGSIAERGITLCHLSSQSDLTFSPHKELRQNLVLTSTVPADGAQMEGGDLLLSGRGEGRRPVSQEESHVVEVTRVH